MNNCMEWMIECRMEWKRRPGDANADADADKGRPGPANKTLFVSFHYFPHLSVFIPLLIEFIKCKHANKWSSPPTCVCVQGKGEEASTHLSWGAVSPV